MAMDWMNKAKSAVKSADAIPSRTGPSFGTSSAPPPTASNVRISNGLKEFLWLISDVRNGRILDLGQVSQATLTFFIEKGYRVSTEDFLRS